MDDSYKIFTMRAGDEFDRRRAVRFGLSSTGSGQMPHVSHFDNQNARESGDTVPLAAERERLRSLASYLRTIDAGEGELEIFIHNWARMMERIALEMETFGVELLEAGRTAEPKSGPCARGPGHNS